MLTKIEGFALVDLIQELTTATLDATRTVQSLDAIDAPIKNCQQAHRKLLDYILSITDMNSPLP